MISPQLPGLFDSTLLSFDGVVGIMEVVRSVSMDPLLPNLSISRNRAFKPELNSRALGTPAKTWYWYMARSNAGIGCHLGRQA